MLWNQGSKDLIEVPWRHGVLYVPEEMMFHQHFSTSKVPARYLAISLGSRRFPFSQFKRDGVAGETDTDVKKGGRQIEYADQHPGIHKKWLAEIARTGVVADMDAYVFKKPKAKAKTKAKPKVKSKPKAKTKTRVKVAAKAVRKPAKAKAKSKAPRHRK